MVGMGVCSKDGCDGAVVGTVRSGAEVCTNGCMAMDPTCTTLGAAGMTWKKSGSGLWGAIGIGRKTRDVERERFM